MIGTYPAEEMQAIIAAYQRTGSYEVTALQEGIYRSFAGVQRAISVAAEMGMVEKNPTGRPRADRERIFELMDAYPHATIGQIAMLANCSEATIFRAKKGR